jgi:putative transport protein
MTEILRHNPLLLLFVVAALGALIGRVRVAGFSFGLAAVLFVGLFFGSLHPDLKLPEVVYMLGLVLFVYPIGLASGPSFFAAFRQRGLRDNLFVLALLALGGALVAFARLLLGWPAAVGAGVFTGAFTNTPALAGVLETLKARGLTEALQAQPVIGYSVCYPVGVIGLLVAIALAKRIWKVPPEAPPEPLVHRSVLVMHPEAMPTLPPVRLGRWQHRGTLGIHPPGGLLAAGDVISVIGHRGDVDTAAERLGEPIGQSVPGGQALEERREDLDLRRILVSKAKVAGRTVGDLHLPERFGAIITRVRRGDTDLLASDEMVLELGDQVRVVAPAEQLPEVARLLGDSPEHGSEVNVLTFGLGTALGLLLGLIPIPLPGGSTFRLGFAGGPLIVGLILGARQRTGPFLWQLPHGANLTLRQVGLVLFLAGVGTRSGWAFATTFQGSLGLELFLTGAALTCGTALLTLWAGHRWLHIPFAHLTGLLSGLQTQPAALAFATDQTRSQAPNLAYASVYPLATIAKIVIAQLLLTL